MSTLLYSPSHGVSAPLASACPSAIRQLLLLAPAPDVFPSSFERVAVNPHEHNSLLSQMQRLRGAVYLADGAIRSADLLPDGRHVMPSDRDSFHVLARNGAGRVVGCVRFLPHHHDLRFEQLALAHSPLASDPVFGPALRQAVADQIASARLRGFLYVEVGGWALDQSIRHTSEAMRIAFLNFSLGLALGGAVGICTATVRNHSADILRRIGGRSLTCNNLPIPRYFDARYGCEIDVVAFDSDRILQRHASRIEQLRVELGRTQVFCNQHIEVASLRALSLATQSETRLNPTFVAA